MAFPIPCIAVTCITKYLPCSFVVALLHASCRTNLFLYVVQGWSHLEVICRHLSTKEPLRRIWSVVFSSAKVYVQTHGAKIQDSGVGTKGARERQQDLLKHMPSLENVVLASILTDPEVLEIESLREQLLPEFLDTCLVAASCSTDAGTDGEFLCMDIMGSSFLRNRMLF